MYGRSNTQAIWEKYLNLNYYSEEAIYYLLEVFYFNLWDSLDILTPKWVDIKKVCPNKRLKGINWSYDQELNDSVKDISKHGIFQPMIAREFDSSYEITLSGNHRVIVFNEMAKLLNQRFEILIFTLPFIYPSYRINIRKKLIAGEIIPIKTKKVYVLKVIRDRWHKSIKLNESVTCRDMFKVTTSNLYTYLYCLNSFKAILSRLMYRWYRENGSYPDSWLSLNRFLNCKYEFKKWIETPQKWSNLTYG